MNKIITGLSNFWKWRKVIYNDRDWDHYFIYEILKTKLENMSDHFSKYGMRERDTTDSETMMHCVRLIEKIQNEECADEAIKQMMAEKWDQEIAMKYEAKHDKLRKSLFDILDKNIEYWWT